MLKKAIESAIIILIHVTAEITIGSSGLACRLFRRICGASNCGSFSSCPAPFQTYFLQNSRVYSLQTVTTSPSFPRVYRRHEWSFRPRMSKDAVLTHV
jgi:hypothetical protein